MIVAFLLTYEIKFPSASRDVCLPVIIIMSGGYVLIFSLAFLLQTGVRGTQGGGTLHPIRGALLLLGKNE